MLEAGRQLSHPQPRPELERECACETLERAWFEFGSGFGFGLEFGSGFGFGLR